MEFQPGLPELKDLQLEVLISANSKPEYVPCMPQAAGSDLNLLFIRQINS